MNRRRGALFALAVVAIGLAPFVPALARGEIFVTRDHVDFFAPLRFFTSAVMRSGELPLWNPLNGSGERWMANPETAVFYPPAWMFLVLPFTAAYVLYLAFHVVVLGLGCFVLFRRRTSDHAAFFGAVAVMLAGPTLSLLDTSNVLTTLSWIPWVLWSALELAIVPLAVPVAAVALLLLGGEPVLAPIAIAAFLAIAVASRRGRKGLASVAVAFVVAAVQLVPFAEMLVGSDRSGPQPVPLRGTLSFRDLLVSTVSPVSAVGGLELLSSTQEFLLVLYVAPLVLFLALVALAGNRRLPEHSTAIRGWSAFTVVALAAAMIPPDSLPVTLNRYPAKFFPVAIIGLVALAVIGLHDAARIGRRARLVAAALAAFVSGAGWVAIERGTASSVLIHVSIACFWIGVACFIAIVPVKLSSRSATIGLAILVAVDAYAASHSLFRSAPPDPLSGTPLRFVSPTQKFMRLLDPALVAHRGFDRKSWATGYQNLYAGVFDVSSPSPVVSRRYLALLDETMSKPRQDVAEWLSAGYVVTAAELRGPSLQPVGRAGEATVYRDYRSLPMASMWSGFITAPTDEEAQRAVMSGSFDAVERIVVTDSPALRGFTAGGAAQKANARITKMRLNEVEVHAATEGAAVLSLNQLRAPGWRLTMDGVPHAELTVNGMFRGTLVPPGRHVFLWSYRPRFVYASALLSVIGIAIAIAELLLVLRRRKSSTACRKFLAVKVSLLKKRKTFCRVTW